MSECDTPPDDVPADAYDDSIHGEGNAHCSSSHGITSREQPFYKYATRNIELSELNRVRLPERSAIIFANLHAQRKKGLLCDATIRIGLSTFPVHRNVLAAASSYFSAMFTGSFAEKTKSCIDINGMSETVFSDLLDYMYGQELKLDFANILEIYGAADMLCLEEIVEECEMFFKKNWHTSPSLHAFYQMAKGMEFNDTDDMIIEDFRNHLPISKLKEVPFEFLSEVLEGRSVTWKDVNKEYRLADRLVKWVFHKPEERSPQLGLEICSKLHFELIVDYNFKTLLEECHLEEDVEGDQIALQSFEAGLEDLYNKSHSILSKHNIEIILLCPYYADGGYAVYVFNTLTWEWKSWKFVLDSQPKTAILNQDDLYVFGKECGHKININNQTVKKLPPFDITWSGSAFDVVDEVCIGEYNRSIMQYLQEVLELKPNSDSWSSTKGYPVWQNSTVYVMIPHAGCLYFVHNFSWKEINFPGKEIYLYNRESNSIEKVCDLSRSVSQPSLVIHDGYLYVFVGKSVQQIDLTRGKCQQDIVFENALDPHQYLLVAAYSVEDGIVVAYRHRHRYIVLQLVKPAENFQTEILGVIPLPDDCQYSFDQFWNLKAVTLKIE